MEGGGGSITGRGGGGGRITGRGGGGGRITGRGGGRRKDNRLWDDGRCICEG